MGGGLGVMKKIQEMEIWWEEKCQIFWKKISRSQIQSAPDLGFAERKPSVFWVLVLNPPTTLKEIVPFIFSPPH